MPETTIREIEESDLFNGFLQSLDSLRPASGIDKLKAKQIFEKIQSNPNHVIFVALIGNRVVGSTSMLIEPKFIHDGGHVGHIEDVVVSKEHQGEGIGKKLIQALLEYSKKNSCYKTILNCSDEVKPFYEKIGFKKESNEMRYNHV